MLIDLPVKTLLVDDHPAYRAGVAALLDLETRVRDIVEAGTVSAALTFARQHSFGLAIVDVMLPDTSGLALVRELHALQPDCRILVLSMVDEPIRVTEMLRAGATGYALKSQPVDDLMPAVRAVLEGHRYLPPGFESTVAENEPLPLDRLTRRERSVFELLVRGLGSRGVAERLAVARRTIDEHRRRIMQKLEARSIVDLIRIAMRYGVLDDKSRSMTAK